MYLPMPCIISRATKNRSKNVNKSHLFLEESLLFHLYRKIGKTCIYTIKSSKYINHLYVINDP